MDEEKTHRVPPIMTARARRLRGEATFPERLLWGRLRDRRVSGLKFRRQHAMGPYIADFFWPECGLAIELDGHSHDTTAKADRKRDEYLQGHGVHVLRFGNDEVLGNLDGVLEAIANAAEAFVSGALSRPPCPPPERERG